MYAGACRSRPGACLEFVSLKFAAFLLALVAAYYGVGRALHRGQWVVLLAGSLGYYLIVGTPATLALMVTTAAVTWAGSRQISRLDDRCKDERAQAADRAEKKAIKQRYARRKQVVFWLALAVCFGILAWLKYANALAAALGLAASPRSWHLLLPLGISFYTFQSVSYLIDCYNGKAAPQPNFAKHLLFVTYFPQILQGPINRYNDLAPQLLAPHAADAAMADRALLRLGYGVIKKCAIADLLVGVIGLALDHVTPATPGSVIVLGILLYSAQQYADFSGGIDIVEGASELLGIRMGPNFRQPYFSVSLADFWRRWHISLGAWMRDYVFYPFALTAPMQRLGKSLTRRWGRHLGRPFPACIANIVVFLLVGVWHGPETHFVAWGLYNGLVIAAADLCAPAFARLLQASHLREDSAALHIWRVVRTFVVVNIGWYFDRIYDFGTSLLAFRNTFANFAPGALAPYLYAAGMQDVQPVGMAVAALTCVFVFAVSLAYERGGDVRAWVLGLHPALRFVLYFLACALVASALRLSLGGGGGFMYAHY